MRVSELWLVCVHLFTVVSQCSVNIYVSVFILKLHILLVWLRTIQACISVGCSMYFLMRAQMRAHQRLFEALQKYALDTRHFFFAAVLRQVACTYANAFMDLFFLFLFGYYVLRERRRRRQLIRVLSSAFIGEGALSKLFRLVFPHNSSA